VPVKTGFWNTQVFSHAVYWICSNESLNDQFCGGRPN